MDVGRYNSGAWDRQVEAGNEWTVPVSSETIASARRGEWEVVLTPVRPVPRDWFVAVALADGDVLCLASGGGQQAPVLAAAGARVTVLDASPRQLEQDRAVAEREGLELRLELGRMHDLSRFADESFDLVFHPVSNIFTPEVRPVWRECFRVLRPGGVLLAGITNPLLYLLDSEREDRGELVIRHSIPYADLEALGADELERRMERGEPLEFGHTLEDQIGGQLDAGFVLTGFYEDGQPGRRIAELIPIFIATRAVKPERAA